jgi:hypothetical protein
LLLTSPLAGFAVLAGLLLRIVLRRLRGAEPPELGAFAGGVIAGDALFTFGRSFLKIK